MHKSTLPHKTVTTDVLIIGGGGAGLRAGIEVAKQGAQALVICKEVLGCAHTGMAMGGMNVAINPEATPAIHAKDTLEGGWFINDPNLVKTYTEEMPARIYDLEDYGLLFDRTPSGDFYTWKGGKQSVPLNVCVGDYTGREMMQALVDQMRKLSVAYQDEVFITRLLYTDQGVGGAVGIDLKSGDIIVYKAKATILATGGAGRMYRVTTNAASNTGDGYAMAFEVGARLVDMEMIQFHPTGMIFPDSFRGVLVTEKVRGHGGRLFNNKGERFMEKYYPKLMELSGRDEVARSIYQEVMEGRGTEHGGVYLDVTHWPKGEVEDKIPDVFEQFMNVGVDIRKQPMEIYPTMHHMCGGVEIDRDGITNVPGLFAVGEVVGGIHGANRLGGNSISEGQVFGRRAAIQAVRRAHQKKKKLTHLDKDLMGQVSQELERIATMLTRDKGVSTYELEDTLKDIMWEKVGMNRNETDLQTAKRNVLALAKRMHTIQINHKRLQRNKELQDALELHNMVKTALLSIEAALTRKESRGAHYREDYPQKLKPWQKNVIVYNDNGSISTKVEKTKKLI